MTRKDENTLREMLYKKTNAVIYLLQKYEAKKMDSDTCLRKIKGQYLDTLFIELLNHKNDETHQVKN